MPKRTLRASAQALPKTTQHPDADLIALAERPEAVLPSPSPATAGESQQFLDLVERIKNSSVELPIARKKEWAALQRFVASAPLPSMESQHLADKKEQFRLKIVRESLPIDQRYKARRPGEADGPICIAVSVCDAYDELRTKLPGTGEGDAYRRMTGVSRHYERRLFVSADEAGYGSALIRRTTIENDLFAAVGELLQHKPKTVNGLRMQACACLLDPGFRWDAYPHMQGFLVSAAEFGTPEDADRVLAASQDEEARS
jgi:hypothetical protein